MRGHGAIVPARIQVVNRAAGNRITRQQRPLDGGNPPVTRQQRGVVADRPDACARQRLGRDKGVGVRRHDQVAVFFQRLAGHFAWALQHGQGQAGLLRGQCQPVVGGVGHHPHDLMAIFQQLGQYRRAKIARADQGAFQSHAARSINGV